MNRRARICRASHGQKATLRGHAIFCLLAVAFVMVMPEAKACSCTKPSSRSGVAEAADYGAVLAGRVIALSLDEKKSGANSAEHGRHLVHARIQVLATWKGARQSEVRLETDYLSGMCGFPFKLGESYLIYARGDAEPYHVDLCSPTKPLATANSEEKDLDAHVRKSFQP